jgi:hypothetical protein
MGERTRELDVSAQPNESNIRVGQGNQDRGSLAQQPLRTCLCAARVALLVLASGACGERPAMT